MHTYVPSIHIYTHAVGLTWTAAEYAQYLHQVLSNKVLYLYMYIMCSRLHGGILTNYWVDLVTYIYVMLFIDNGVHCSTCYEL